jgi:hypothetical protein
MNNTRISAVMEKARDLQVEYNMLNSPATQRVRNPFPMWKLVLNILPRLSDPFARIPIQETVTVIALGNVITQKKNTQHRPAWRVMDKNYWETNALTVSEIVERLQSRGFAANRGAVHLALVHNRYSYNVKSFASRERSNAKGKPYSKYFLGTT